MAVASQTSTPHPAPSPSWTSGAFTLGRPASRIESVTGRLVSLPELLRPHRKDDRPPLASSIAKLTLWIVAAMGITTASAVAIGVLLVRTYLAAVH